MSSYGVTLATSSHQEEHTPLSPGKSSVMEHLLGMSLAMCWSCGRWLVLMALSMPFGKTEKTKKGFLPLPLISMRRYPSVLMTWMLLHMLHWDSKGARFQGGQALEGVYVWRFPLPPVFSQSRWGFFLEITSCLNHAST